MTLRVSRLARLGIGAALIAFLTSAGAGAAWGYWSASTSVSTTAAAATVGVDQQLASGSTLALSYDSSTTSGAGAITITNTSTRDGSYTLTLDATSSSSALLGSVDVTIGTASACTPTASLAGSVTAPFASHPSKTGTLAAGGSATLCVQTAMTSADIAASGGTSLSATVAASIAVGSWTASASPITFIQSVASSAAASLGPGWYQLKTAQSPARCVEFNYSGGGRADQTSCQTTPDATQLWRFAATTNGYARIVAKTNGSWWQVTSAKAGTKLTLGSATSTLSEWMVTDAGNGTIEISLRADPTLCLQAPPSTRGDQSFTLQSCGPSTILQRLVPVASGDASPAPVTLTCASDGYNLYLSWPALTGYQGDVAYRVWVDGRLDTIHGRGSGWDTTIQWGGSFASTYGTGAHQIVVEQSVFGASWTTTGTGGATVTSLNGPYFRCD